MVYRATQQVQDAFDRKGLKSRIQALDTFSFVETGFAGSNVDGICIRFLSFDGNSDVSVRVLNYVKGQESSRARLLEACNAMNRKYRHVKFCLDKDCSVDLEADVPLSVADPGDICVELFARVGRVADEAYPVFMKAIG